MFDNLTFANPEFFLLLLLIPIFAAYFLIKKPERDVYMRLPSLDFMEDIISWRSIMLKFLPVIRALAFSAFVVALARPQISLKEEEVKAEGIDIMMIMDLSSSMLAQDFDPDRLSVSKKVAAEFVDKRKFDRVGLAVFAGESFTQCPLTTDHRVVKDFLASLQCGMLEDGTAIGMGLASGVNRLKDSEAKSKVLILLTDGVNNAGYIQPITAAEIAKEYNVKIYTIGVGSQGNALSPLSRRSDGRYVFGMTKVEIDEALLTEIAQMTGGRYFRATSETGLGEIYNEIDQLEKTEMEVNVFLRHTEEFRRFLLIGLLLLLIEVLFRFTFLRTIP
jgi:Ca-activated chloride channel family protein